MRDIRDMRAPPVAPVVLAVLAAGTVLLVVGSLDRPAPPTFMVTPPRPVEVGDTLVGPIVYTVDASSPDRWIYFDFSRGSVVEAPEPTEWDLAFSRFAVIVNGGEGFAGRGGAQDLGEVMFDSVTVVPSAGYTVTEAGADSVHPALARWYDYSFTSHLLTPKSRVYAVRTADGRYARLRFLGYYCPGAQPGCVTFQYTYQGGGGRAVTELAGDSMRPN
jgi:hypothetical protein